MNILGMGPMEILLIVVLALIVFGPAKLPEIMGQVGRAIAEFRRTTSQLSDEFNRTIQAELQETRSMVDDIKAPLTGVHSSINSAISGTPAPTLTATPANGVPAAQPVTNGTNGAVAAAEKPPLADTAQWSWETAAPAPAKPAVEVPAPVAAAVEEPVVTPPAPEPAPPAPVKKAAPRNDILPPY
jgi:TatA/E family protein of Tat protein translocase